MCARALEPPPRAQGRAHGVRAGEQEDVGVGGERQRATAPEEPVGSGSRSTPSGSSGLWSSPRAPKKPSRRTQRHSSGSQRKRRGDRIRRRPGRSVRTTSQAGGSPTRIAVPDTAATSATCLTISFSVSGPRAPRAPRRRPLRRQEVREGQHDEGDRRNRGARVRGAPSCGSRREAASFSSSSVFSSSAPSVGELDLRPLERVEGGRPGFGVDARDERVLGLLRLVGVEALTLVGEQELDEPLRRVSGRRSRGRRARDRSRAPPGPRRSRKWFATVASGCSSFTSYR